MTVKITIGADPEYGLLQSGRLIPPGNVIETSNEFGVDGCSSIGELRPPPAECPKELTKTIQRIILKGVRQFPELLNYTMKAGGTANENALGGHIHFGHVKLQESDDCRDLINKALNRTIAVLVAMIEDEEEAINRRMGTPYGSIEDRAYETQPWGMEYRVLPSWLTTPKECDAILSTAFAIVSEVDNKDTIEEAANLPGYDTQSFRECDKLSLMYHVPPIVEFVKRLPLYEKYEEQIKHLFRMIKNREVWSCTKDMMDSWDIRSQVKKKEAAIV